MLADELDAPREVSPEELLERYQDALAGVIDDVGVERAHEATGLPDATLVSLRSGGGADLFLEDAAAILALTAETDAETIIANVRDRLMLEMSGAAIDVDTVAVELDTDLDAKEIQAKMEGRFPMTLEEYARIYRYIAAEADW